MAIEGVDFANQRPSGSALRAADKRFVVRYLSPNSANNPRKLLTAAEVTEYHGADLSICVVWETGTSRARTGGYAGGRADAAAAHRQLIALHGPAQLPIYFAIDEDTTGPAVEAYFQGVADAIGLARTGAYGGIRPISYLFDNHRISLGWQTYAWSGGRWDPRAQAQQYDNDQTVPGVGSGYDLDRAMTANYGQWNPDGTFGDTGAIDMTDVNVISLSLAALAAIWGFRVDNAGAPPADGQPVSAAVAVRASYFRDGYVANTGVPEIEASLAAAATAQTDEASAIAALSAKLDGIPAAVVAALPTGPEGGWLTPTQIEAACQQALSHLGLTVAP